MSKKRWIAGLMSAVMALSVLFVNPTETKASEWFDNILKTKTVKEIKVNTSYVDAFTEDEFESDGPYSYYACKLYKIKVPEDGEISARVEFPELEYISSINHYYIYFQNAKQEDDHTAEIGMGFGKTDDGKGYYYVGPNIPVKKGSNYILIEDADSEGQLLTCDYNLSIEYTPTVKPVYIVDVCEKKKALSITWKKENDIKGYEIEYSLKEDFSSKTKKIVVKNKKATKEELITKELTKLKSNKIYYLRMRSFKNVKVNGKTNRYYSDWKDGYYVYIL